MNQIYRPHDADYIARFSHKNPDGRLWSDDNLTAKGISLAGAMNTNTKESNRSGAVP